MSTSALPLSDICTDALTGAVDALAKAHEAGEVSALDAVALFLPLSDALAAWLGDAKGCDGCDLRLSAEAVDWAGLSFAHAEDANGDPDVQVCPFCKEEGEAAWRATWPHELA